MQSEKIITATAVVITPAQKELLDLCSHIEVPDILEGIEQTFYLALYGGGDDIPRDMMQRVYQLKRLQNCLTAISGEGRKPQITMAT